MSKLKVTLKYGQIGYALRIPSATSTHSESCRIHHAVRDEFRNVAKSNALRSISGETEYSNTVGAGSAASILHAQSEKFGGGRISDTVRRKLTKTHSGLVLNSILYALRKESWNHARLHPEGVEL